MSIIYPAESSAGYLFLIIKGCNDFLGEKDGRTDDDRGRDEVSRHNLHKFRGNCLSSFVWTLKLNHLAIFSIYAVHFDTKSPCYMFYLFGCCSLGN